MSKGRELQIILFSKTSTVNVNVILNLKKNKQSLICIKKYASWNSYFITLNTEKE